MWGDFRIAGSAFVNCVRDALVVTATYQDLASENLASIFAASFRISSKFRASRL
jgi:hypothetical protein